MSKRTSDEGSWEKSGDEPPRPVDQKKIVVEFTRSFDDHFANLPLDLQEKCRRTIDTFIDCYLTRQFPKGLRVHKCGPFVNISISMNYRILLLPIPGGIKFVFVGNHEDADRYLRKK